MRSFQNSFIACVLAASFSVNPFLLSESIPKEEGSANRIVEIVTFSDLLKYARPNSLVLIDIDDTLIEAEQTMGTDRWFIWRQEYYAKQGVDPELGFNKALLDWMAVQCLTRMKLTETGTDLAVKQLQNSGIVSMGLTTRGGSFTTGTVYQLQNVGIDLSLAAPSKEEIVFLNPHPVLYKNGILFTAGAKKGESLFTFLKMIKYPIDNIQEIVFINDKKSHLADVQEACAARGIPFLGLRYGFSDERIRNFSEDIAELQFKHFGKLISDKEAREELANYPLTDKED